MKYIYSLLIALLLTACSEEVPTLDVMYNRVLTPEESYMVRYLYINNSCINSSITEIYTPIMDTLYQLRKQNSTVDDSIYKPKNPERPFCEVATLLNGTEARTSKALRCNNGDTQPTSITDIYKATYQTDKILTCGDSNKAPRKAPVDEQFKVTTDKEGVKLSPQLYDDLIRTVQTCKRAEYSVISGFKPNQELTPDDYDKVVQIILECKKFQLESALNEKPQ